jgi:hypothetical protein
VHRTFLGDHLSYRVEVEAVGTVDVIAARSIPTAVELFGLGDEVTLEWALNAGRVIQDVGESVNGNGGGSAPGKEGADA